MDDRLSALLARFGLSDFTPEQETLTAALLGGRDVLCSMPAGEDRDLCWQLAAAALPGLTLVLSPSLPRLRAHLRRLQAAGVSAMYLESGFDPARCQEALAAACSGGSQILCAHPSLLEGHALLALACSAPVSLVVVEEAQRIAPHSREHSPVYTLIPDLIRLLPNRPVLAAFTGVTGPELREEVCNQLLLHDPLRSSAGFLRKKLALDVAAPRRKDPWVLDFVRSHTALSGVIWCSGQRVARSVCDMLTAGGITAACCYPGLPEEELSRRRDSYLADHVQVLVAADGLALELDKPNIRFMLHYSVPHSLEDYCRQISLAGRDGEPAQCVLLFSPGDIQAARMLAGGDRSFALAQLDRVVDYCKSSRCLQQELLDYLGQEAPEPCGCCGNCCCRYVRQDITREARLILTALGRVEEKFPFGLGRPLVVLLLHGDRDRRVQRMGLDQLPDFGLLAQLSKPQIRAYIDALIREGCLYTTEGAFPVLRPTDLGRQALARGDCFTYRVRMKKQSNTQKPPQPELTPREAALVEALKALRMDIAREQGLPAYVIFSNAILAHMARLQPRTPEELLQISGVGKVKTARYGSRFLDCIRAWTAAHP